MGFQVTRSAITDRPTERRMRQTERPHSRPGQQGDNNLNNPTHPHPIHQFRQQANRKEYYKTLVGIVIRRNVSFL